MKGRRGGRRRRLPSFSSSFPPFPREAPLPPLPSDPDFAADALERCSFATSLCFFLRADDADVLRFLGERIAGVEWNGRIVVVVAVGSVAPM